MKFNLIQKSVLSAVLMGSVLLAASCGDAKPQSKIGTIGPIEIDRERVGVNQPFTLTCAVIPGENLIQERWLWTFGVLVEDAVIENGTASRTFYAADKPGEYTYGMVYQAISNTPGMTEISLDKTVKVVETDVRNSFWGESRTETERNIRYYTDKAEIKDRYIAFQEKDFYSGVSLGDRTVYYSIVDNKLNGVMYNSNLAEKKDDRLVAGLALRVQSLSKEDGFGGFVYTYEVYRGMELTGEEKNLAEQFTTGNLVKLDENGVLGKAVRDGKLSLNISGSKIGSTLNIEATIFEGDPVVGLMILPAK